MENTQEIALELEHVSKSFGKVQANHDVSMTLYKGEILAILGENGCGKTTLMNIIAGIYYPDSGSIKVNGEKVHIHSPQDAFNYHIGMVHQHFKLVDVFNGTDNILLGEGKKHFSIKKAFGKLNFRKKKDTKHFIEENKLKKNKNFIHDLGLSTYTVLGIIGIFLKYLPKYFYQMGRKFGASIGYLYKERGKTIREICAKYGFTTDLSKVVHEMSVSEKQTVEIIKVLYRGADILILDEPTAVLTPQEIVTFFDILKRMRDDGKSIIIITHKLNEVMAVSDRVTILRKGEYIDTVLTSKTNEKQLTDLMVGRKMDLNIERPTPVNPKDRLSIEHLTTYDKDHKKILDDISFKVRSGEILGIAGIAGSGQKELLEAIAGLCKSTEGDVIFTNPKKNTPVTLFHKTPKQIKELAAKGTFHYPDGTPVNLEGKKTKEIKKLVNDKQIIFNEDEIMDLKHLDPLEIRELGIHLSFVPEDRLGMGLVGNMSISNNMMLRSYRKGKGPLLDFKRPEKTAQEIIKELDVSTTGSKQPVRKLSGGNVQKVLVGREIAYGPKVLMAAYPVRGLDINSSYTIYHLLNEQKKKGTAVIFVGEDLDVLLALADRIIVINDGYITGEVDPKKAKKEDIGRLMTKTKEVEDD